MANAIWAVDRKKTGWPTQNQLTVYVYCCKENIDLKCMESYRQNIFGENVKLSRALHKDNWEH